MGARLEGGEGRGGQTEEIKGIIFKDISNLSPSPGRARLGPRLSLPEPGSGAAANTSQAGDFFFSPLLLFFFFFSAGQSIEYAS